MPIGWEMNDVTRQSGFAAIEDENLSKSKPPRIALVFVCRECIGISSFEFERDTFSHDADAVHRISNGLHFCVEQVAANKLDHLA
jgi:hypothetical protein